jgi:hypothetical protein
MTFTNPKKEIAPARSTPSQGEGSYLESCAVMRLVLIPQRDSEVNRDGEAL